jgi:hypothetical protein
MIYTIKAGNHYSGFHFRPHLTKHKAAFYAMFTPSCRYDIGPDQSDANKLFGFTLGLSSSVRWAWKNRAGTDKIILVPYVHEDGKVVRPEGRVEIEIGEEIHLTIIRTSDTRVRFLANGSPVAFHDFREKKPYWGRCQYPYFGGNQTAPHDMMISLA